MGLDLDIWHSLVDRVEDGLAHATTRDQHIRWMTVLSLAEQLRATPPTGSVDGPAAASGPRSTVRTG